MLENVTVGKIFQIIESSNHQMKVTELDSPSLSKGRGTNHSNHSKFNLFLFPQIITTRL